MGKLMMIVVCLALAGCGSQGVSANTSPGSDPGAGFGCAHNAFQGCAAP
jgi:hypothetical protein